MPLILKSCCKPFGTKPPVKAAGVCHSRCKGVTTAARVAADISPCRHAIVSGLASLCLVVAPQAAVAYNVKLEDVESPAMQSGDSISKAVH